MPYPLPAFYTVNYICWRFWWAFTCRIPSSYVL